MRELTTRPPRPCITPCSGTTMRIPPSARGRAALLRDADGSSRFLFLRAAVGPRTSSSSSLMGAGAVAVRAAASWGVRRREARRAVVASLSEGPALGSSTITRRFCPCGARSDHGDLDPAGGGGDTGASSGTTSLRGGGGAGR
jgi:hypothetical protein